MEAVLFAMRQVRARPAFLEDSTFSPPWWHKMLTKPRTVCFCQPVAATISASVAPLARFIIAITASFLPRPFRPEPLPELSISGHFKCLSRWIKVGFSKRLPPHVRA